MVSGTCPNCESKVEIGERPEVGKHVTCKSCKSESVIVWLNPIELEPMDGWESDNEEEYFVEDYQDYE
jgi:lysine biosynthesis protein LysW